MAEILRSSETFFYRLLHRIQPPLRLRQSWQPDPTSTPSPVGEGRGEGKTTAPISDDPKTQGRLKSPANHNLTAGNRLKEYNGIEYTYDALGNLIYRQLPDGENQYYQYDLENQLVRAEIKKPAGNTEIWEYAYDPFGRRLSKERQDKLAWTSTEPKRTHFVWDGSRLLQEYTYKGCYTYIYTDQDTSATKPGGSA